MYESDFVLIENEKMTLEELRQELGTVVQNEVIFNELESKRSVSQQPMPEDTFDTFYLHFDIKDSQDFISVVTNVSKEKHLVDYDLHKKKLDIQLINYNQRDEK